jgi:hypothetical protein
MQTYRNYHRDYFKTPSGREAQRRARRKYRQKIAKRYNTSQAKAAQLIKERNNMSGRKGTKNINQREFDQLKAMVNLGLTAKQLHDISGRSPNTLSMIRQSENFEQYKVVREAATKRYRPSPEVKAFSEATDSVNAASTTPELVEALNDLSQAMNALAVSWNGLSDKMDDVLETKRPWMFGQKRG